MYFYLQKLKFANEKKSRLIDNDEEKCDVITSDELDSEFFILDNCKKAYYNYYTMLDLFVVHENFFNPLTRQQIKKIRKVRFR